MNGNGIDTRHKRRGRWDRHHHSHNIPHHKSAGMSRERPERDPNVPRGAAPFAAMRYRAVVLVGGDNRALILRANAAATFDTNGRSLSLCLPLTVRCVDTPALLVKCGPAQADQLFCICTD